MTYVRRAAVAALFVLLLIPTTVSVQSAPAAAGALPGGITRAASVEGITEYQLPNGLRVLLFPDPSKQTATVNVTYLVGSRHEGLGETGMAHLLEHLVFKGTPNHPDIPKELTSHGCRPNGSTWYDRTNYFETFAASEENLDWALDLEADRMVNSYIAKKDLDSEFSVVRNEFEVGENSPQDVLLERMMSTAYLWHNYGKSTIGSREDIERVPIDNLKAFYQKWYQPDNAILVVAGKFDEARTLRRIHETFGKIPRPTRTLANPWTVEPAQDGERMVTLRRVGDVQMAGALYHVPSGSHPDFAPLDLLAFILGDAPSGRLHKALVETQKASSVAGFAWQLHDPGVLMLTAEVRTGASLEEAKEILLRTAEETATSAPTREEVDRARNDRLKDWDTTMRSSERAAIELSEWAALGDWRLMFIHRDRLKAVTPDDVRRVAQTYLKPENRTVGMYIPTAQPSRAAIPAKPDVAALVKNYKGGEAMAMGEAFDPAPAAVEARVQRATLAPGIRLAMVPKKTRGGTINVAMTFHLGDEASLQGRDTAGSFAAEMLMRGTKKRTREEIQDELGRMKSQMRVFGGATSASVSIETTRESFVETMRLAAEVLREPAFPASELDQARQETLAALEDARSDPRQKAFTALAKHLNPWPKSDPRYVSSPDEDIESVQKVTIDEVRRFWEDFYGAGAAEIAVVGDIDAAATKSLVEQLFAGFASKKPFARLVDQYQDRPVLRQAIETPDKESAVFSAGLRVPMRDDSSDYPAMVLGNFMTGGGFLNSRLATRIRQKDGLSYGVGSSFNASPFDQDGQFGSFAIYAPQNAERLVTAYEEEIARVIDKGFTDEEIAEAKKGWLQGRNVSRASDRELARTLASREYQKRTLKWDGTVEDQVAKLGSAQILATMRKYLDPAKISYIQAGDFAKAKAAAAAPASQPGGAK
jgi:zinc protease